MILPLIGAALISGAAGLASSAIGASAAKKASKAAAAAAEKNAQLQRDNLTNIGQTVSPYIQSGWQGNAMLQGRVTGTPGSVPNQIPNYGGTPNTGAPQNTPVNGAPEIFGGSGSAYPATSSNPMMTSVSAPAQGQTYGVPAATPATTDWGSYVSNNPELDAYFNSPEVNAVWGPQGKAAFGEAIYAANNGQDGKYGTPVTTPGDPGMNVRPDIGPRPEPGTGRTEVANLPPAAFMSGFSAFNPGKFEESPGYKWQVDEATRAANAQFGAQGLRRSGGLVKAVQDRSTQLASQDYYNWLNEKLAEYNANNSARSSAENAMLQQWGANQGQINYNQNRLDTNFGADRSRLDTNYLQDRTHSDAVFDTDRGFAANRFDTQNADLFKLSGQGLTAAQTLAAAGTNATNAIAGGNDSAAAAKGNAMLTSAAGVNNTLAAGMNLYGQIAGGGSGSVYGSSYAPGQYTYPYMANRG